MQWCWILHCAQSEADSPRKENQLLTDSPSWEPNAKAAQNQCSPWKLPLHWPTVQLQNICSSEVLKPKQGNAEYSVAGTGTVGKWCGQAVTNTVAHLLFTEHLLQGRTTSQCWVCPGHQSWTQKQPQECTRAGAHQVLDPGIFRPVLALKMEFQSIRLGELKVLLFFSPFFLSSFDYLFLPLSPCNRGYRIHIGEILI